MAGVVTLPRQVVGSLRQIEFLPLSERRVLAILVINEKEVQNRILDVDRDYGEDELRRAANYSERPLRRQDPDQRARGAAQRPAGNP